MAGEDEMDMNDLKSILEELPKVVVRRVNALKNQHLKYLESYKKFQADVRALENKYYNEVYQPLFGKRAQIVNGEYEPTAEECKPADPTDEPTNNPDKDEKGIPDFWLTVMQNNSFVGQSIYEHDEDALRSLRDVECVNLSPPQQGFTITFHFAENPYFSNTTLTKNYFLEEDDVFGELVLEKAEGTKINWKPNKNLTVKVVTQKAPGGKRGGAKGKKGAAARTVKVEEPQDSFFQFFSPPTINPEEEPGEDDEILENDFEVGCTFKDKLVPLAALWFTGEAADYEDDMGEDFDEHDFDEDDEIDEDKDEDDDDEDDAPSPPKGKGGRTAAKGPRGAGGHPFAPPQGGAKGGPDQAQQPECKQQ